MLASFFVSPNDLARRLGRPDAPWIVDTRRPAAVEQSGRLLPTGILADPEEADPGSLPTDAEIVVHCLHGHERSQLLTARLRAAGLAARCLEGGYDAWVEAGLPTIPAGLAGFPLGRAPLKLVTRRQPKIDRIACPWLIRRFVDRRAEVLYVDPESVLAVAGAAGGLAFDLPGAPIEHDGPRCSFDTLLEALGLDGDTYLSSLADIVRGADTSRHDLAPQAAGLLAVALGLSALRGEDDHRTLDDGCLVYDALLAWLREAREETHNWPAARPEEAAA